MSNNNHDQFMEHDIPQSIPVIPTIDVVVFPHMVVPLLILDEKIIKGVEAALQGSKKILLLAARQQSADYHGPIGIHDLYKMGTVGNIMRVMHLPEGGVKVLTQGLCKAVVNEIISDAELLQASIKPIDPVLAKQDDQAIIDGHLKNLFALIERMSSTGRMFSPDFQAILAQIQDPERIADFILSHLNVNVPQAQTLLEKNSIADLLEGIHEYLHGECELNNMQERIRTNARESINRSQREYYLREQLKAIQKELGEEENAENDDLKDKIRTLQLPDDVRLEAQRQIRRLEKTPPDSMEATVLRNHLEWLLAMPWGVYTKDNVSISHAKQILDANHYGLNDIKERILDFLSVRFLKQDCNTPILCLAGAPGVGKTSLGQSIATCLGRKFFRISLGGVYDESEIRGHRRTYVGALPGRFIHAVRKAGSNNPIILIDEIDKIGQSNRGDPSAALLEVLDPEQNNTFYDNYLGVHYDLSKVMFIATANDLSNIPGPLRDRMEIIHISGYTHEEKAQIARRHILAKAIKNSGLEDRGITIDSATINALIHQYTREAGVRELERYIQKLCAKYARALVETNNPITINENNLQDYLGPSKVYDELIGHADKIGVTNGLAWTALGGDILQVEAVLMPGTGKLILTGQLGDVIKESAQAALTYAKSHAEVFKIAQKDFTDFDLHIHLPSGGIPKDGPSAGITMLSSVLSAYTRRAIKGDVAMTGELNLRGEVLPIGGVKEKLLAAKQHKLKHIIFPKSNERDLVGLDQLGEGIQIRYVENVQEVLDYVLLPLAV